jgi:hypothetical protein
MPMMVCAVDRNFATTLGYAFDFKKGVPQFVPPRAVSAVMEQGVFPADGEEDAVAAATEDEQAKPKFEPTDYEERLALLRAAYLPHAEAGTVQYTAGGKVSPAWLSKLVEFRVDAAERDVLLASIAAKAD